MTDNFRSLTLKQAIALQIFYTSPDDENLRGKTLYGENWLDNKGIVADVFFRKTGTKKDEALEKLITAKEYKKILQKYPEAGTTFKMVVVYKNDKGKLKEINLTQAIQLTASPDEPHQQIIDFITEKKEYNFLKE
jgi:hypothetical protein